LLKVIGLENIPVAEGNVFMESTDYTSWSRSVNDTYDYIAGELNLTIVP
jgi:hypothetical protein